MNPKQTLLAILALPALACSAAPEGASPGKSESAQTSTSWKQVLQCDDGSVLDVNADERRELQFVIRNDAAKEYLMPAYDPQYFDWNISASGEVIFRGRVAQGIFGPQDFTRAVAISGRPKHQVGDEWGPTVEMVRAGSDITLTASEHRNWVFRGCR